MTTLDEALVCFPYQLELIRYLREEEADLWSWFASTRHVEEASERVRLELLKSTYRYDAQEHAELYATAHTASARLDCSAPITLYQSTEAAAMNAAVAYLPGEVHIILQGPVTSVLSADELQAAFAHEITHYLLWERFDRELYVAAQLLNAIADHPQASPSHLESARLFALYLEVHADRGSMFVTQNPLISTSTLLKVQTGLADVHAESYLRQADEIFSRQKVKTSQLTHPEAYIRARALRLWSMEGIGAFPEIARMLEGADEMKSLDLVGQVRIRDLTRDVIGAFLKPKWFRSEPVLAHARKFFPELALTPSSDFMASRIAELDKSIHDYLAYVLLDFATVDPELEDVPLAAAIDFAEKSGIKETLLRIASKELKVPQKKLSQLEAQHAAMLEAAVRQEAQS